MSPALRIVTLAGAIVAVFAATVAILMRVIPGPHREADYLVIGGVATLVSMLVLFVVLISTVFRGPNTFYRRRKKS